MYRAVIATTQGHKYSQGYDDIIQALDELMPEVLLFGGYLVCYERYDADTESWVNLNAV